MTQAAASKLARDPLMSRSQLRLEVVARMIIWHFPSPSHIREAISVGLFGVTDVS